MLRFAQSPTGDMNISNLRVAIFNYIVSVQRKEDLIIRIEDMDKDSNIDGKDKEILDILNLFGIEYSQIIYQSEQTRFHSAMALQLIHDKKAFSCFCSDDWLDKKRQEAKDDKKEYFYDDACRNLPAELVIDNTAPFTIRIAKSSNEITIKDAIKGDVTFKTDVLDSFIIMRQDKTSMQNFSSAIDDMLNNISIVIRNEKNFNSSPQQEHIRKSLNYDKSIEYAHLPMILNADEISVKFLLEEGFLPEAIINYLILIGNKTPKEIFSMQEAKEWFSLDTISNSPTPFDMDRLRYINTQHLNNLDSKELSRYLGFADDSIGELAKVYLTDVSTTKELREKIEPIFATKNIPAEFSEEVEKLIVVIKNAPYFDEYTKFEKYVMQESNIEEKNFLKLLRLVLTGAENGPDISEIYKHIKNYIGEIVK